MVGAVIRRFRAMIDRRSPSRRYDYRAEWLRFAETMAESGPGSAPLAERAIHVLATIGGSQWGLYFRTEPDRPPVYRSRWGRSTFGVPLLSRELAERLAREGCVIDPMENAGAWRKADGGEAPWALVPLTHGDVLFGAILLGTPSPARPLDREDRDLMRVVGRQLACHLAESEGQAALDEAARFDEFNRRIAFVVHDVKNLASQLSVLASNARRHSDNPAFRQDMLVTLEQSARKLAALLERLGRYARDPKTRLETFELARLLDRVRRAYADRHPVETACPARMLVEADAEALEQALLHLVGNAIDASDPGMPVLVKGIETPGGAMIEILDSGHGMSERFVAEELFRPFRSTRNGGFGIGAFEARELIGAMGGTVEVDSREGLGTRFVILLRTRSELGSEVRPREAA